METQKKIFELKLSEAEFQLLFTSLIKRPFEDVAELVAKMQKIYRGTPDEVVS